MTEKQVFGFSDSLDKVSHESFHTIGRVMILFIIGHVEQDQCLFLLAMRRISLSIRATLSCKALSTGISNCLRWVPTSLIAYIFFNVKSSEEHPIQNCSHCFSQRFTLTEIHGCKVYISAKAPIMIPIARVFFLRGRKKKRVCFFFLVSHLLRR